MKTGDKIICIDFSNCSCGCGAAIPCLPNVIYIVTETYNEHDKLGLPCKGLNLIGVSSLPHKCFAARRFRLLDELKTLSRQKKEKLITL